MIVNVFFENEEFADIITVPDEVGDIEKVQLDFFEWLFDKKNDHGYWVIKDNKKLYCNYGVEAFIKWLNEVVLNKSNKKAKLIKRNCQNYSEYEKKLYFD